MQIVARRPFPEWRFLQLPLFVVLWMLMAPRPKGPARRTAGTPRRSRQAFPDGFYGRIRAFGRPASRRSIPENEK
jgi:hypothetical protein